MRNILLKIRNGKFFNTPLFTFLLLTAFLLAVTALWGSLRYRLNWRQTMEGIAVDVHSENGVWDLQGLGEEYNSFHLTGPVEYIPNALLTPEEFRERQDEAVTGRPQDVSQFATSRMVIRLPKDIYYSFHRRSIDYAHRVFINGVPAAQMGSPGSTKETNIPDSGNITLTLKPEDGMLELVQQASNFVHREGGAHDQWHVKEGGIRPYLEGALYGALYLGAFLSLFIVHIILFLFLQKYKANLYFALFCLMWFLRTGVTGSKIFTSLLPALSWYAKFRIEYLAFPVTAVLLTSLLDVLFPKILHKWFRYGLYCVSAAVCAIFLFADTVFMSYAMTWCYAVYLPAIMYIFTIFAVRLRHINFEQSIFLAGVAVFLLSVMNEVFSLLNLFDSITRHFHMGNLTSFTMLLFTFCQASTIFLITARNLKTTTAENAALKERIRMTELRLEEHRKIQKNTKEVKPIKIELMDVIFEEQGLSDREKEVARILLEKGDMNVKEIGKFFCVSESTIKTHISSIYKKFAVNKRSEFMAMFVK